MNMILGTSINDVYKTLSDILTTDPTYTSSPRGLKIREITNVAIEVTNPYERILTMRSRNMSLRYLAGEISFYLAGSNDLEFISHYSSSWNRLSTDGKTVVSAYGKRLFKEPVAKDASQMDYCERCLREDKDTRQAVMVIYRASDSSTEERDHPCTMSLQFIIRDNRLHLTVTMRSNDMWYGVPYDFAFFMFVQELMLSRLRDAYPSLAMGSYVHFVGSLHVYERNWDGIANASRENISELSCEMPKIGRSFPYELPLFLSREERIRKEGDKNRYCYADHALTWLMDHLQEGSCKDK